jgi:hypothetical protein
MATKQEPIRPMQYNDQQYCLVPYSRIKCSELLLFKDIQLDADLEACVIPLKGNEASVSVLLMSALPKLEDLINKVQGL